MFRTPHIALVAGLMASSLLIACAKKIKVNGQDVAANKDRMGNSPAPGVDETPPPPDLTPTAPEVTPPPPAGKSEPVEIPNGLSADRTHYQTRSTVTLRVAGAVAAPGEEVSLVNLTTGASLLDRQPLSLELLQDPVPGLSLVVAPADLYLRLYPMASELAGKLAYGNNELQASVDGEAPKVAKQSIVLRDFSTAGVQLLRFDGNRQRSGKLQGEITGYTKPTARGGKSLLTTGFLPLVNQ